jgi:chemotaxis family two-component system response regulator Rcp1
MGIVFRILIVDDDPAGVNLLRELMKNLHRQHELHFVWDGVEALDFLHRRGAYANAPRPNLILLDVNLPRLGGLETLSAIKSHPELCVIPVIMLSTSSSPHDVRKSYQARANCYVQKPTDLGRSVMLIQAVEAFWMDFALLPTGEDRYAPRKRQLTDSKRDNPTFDAPSGEIRSGQPIAFQPAEASSQAMQNERSPAETSVLSGRSECEEHNRLLDGLGLAVREIIELHEQQFAAIREGDTECHRFDLLTHMANEKKQLAKYAYLRHVEAHGCATLHVFKQART